MKMTHHATAQDHLNDSGVASLAEQQRLRLLSPRKWYRGSLMVSTDKLLLDCHFLTQALATSRHDPRQRALALRGSLCFGLYRNQRQIGFARQITDLCSTAMICDLFISPEYRFCGLGSWLLNCCLSHPATRHCGTLFALTATASPFLHKNGFISVAGAPGIHLPACPAERADDVSHAFPAI